MARLAQVSQRIHVPTKVTMGELYLSVIYHSYIDAAKDVQFMNVKPVFIRKQKAFLIAAYIAHRILIVRMIALNLILSHK